MCVCAHRVKPARNHTKRSTVIQYTAIRTRLPSCATAFQDIDTETSEHVYWCVNHHYSRTICHPLATRSLSSETKQHSSNKNTEIKSININKWLVRSRKVFFFKNATEWLEKICGKKCKWIELNCTKPKRFSNDLKRLKKLTKRAVWIATTNKMVKEESNLCVDDTDATELYLWFENEYLNQYNNNTNDTNPEPATGDAHGHDGAAESNDDQIRVKNEETNTSNNSDENEKENNNKNHIANRRRRRSKDKNQKTDRRAGGSVNNCTICDSSFNKQIDYELHMLKVHDIKPFECFICGMKFSRKCYLPEHMRRHTGEKPFRCSECTAAFSRASDLKKHNRSHQGIRLYECKVCNKRYTRSFSLNNHLRSHTGERPFICDICGIGFSRSTYLNDHKKTHLTKGRKKAFECVYCKVKLKSRQSLRYHFKKKHWIHFHFQFHFTLIFFEVFSF